MKRPILSVKCHRMAILQFVTAGVLFLSIIPLTSYASTCNDNCTETPTCESLGYFKDATCENEYITCPFDSSYKWCK